MPTVIGPATFSLAPAPNWDDGEDDESPNYSSSKGDSEDGTPKAHVARKRSKKRKGGDTANIPLSWKNHHLLPQQHPLLPPPLPPPALASTKLKRALTNTE